jgi:putative membrane protein
MLFIDYVPLMLLNMAAGLFVLGYYACCGIGGEHQTRWAPAFGMTGLIALACGLHMVWNWPLPGSYNVAFGEMSVLLGVLFLGAAWAVAKGWNLHVVVVYGIFASLAAILIGARITDLELTQTPRLTYAGFLLTGLGGILFALVVFLGNKLLRMVAGAVLAAAALIWLWIGLNAYWGHLLSLKGWLPVVRQMIEK